MAATHNDYERMHRKYVNMAKHKAPWEKTTNILTPTMGEMLEEDLAYESFVQKNGSIDSTNNPSNTAFYTEKPAISELGYDADLDALLVKADLKLDIYNNKDVSWIWNKYDGDTLYLKADTINSGDKPIVANGIKYKDFQEYLNSAIFNYKVVNTKEIGIRFVGINCGEVPHFSPTYIKKKDINQKVVVKKFKDIRGKVGYSYYKYPMNNRSNNDYKITERSDEEYVFLLKTRDENGSFTYNEIVQTNKNLYPQHKPVKEEPKNLESFITSNRSLPGADNDTVPVLIVGTDESELTNIVDGYKAQQVLKTSLSKLSDIRFLLDAGTLQMANRDNKSGVAILNLFYTPQFCRSMISDVRNTVGDLKINGFTYTLYGMDTYGRYLAAVYGKTSDGTWVNLNKLILVETPTTVAQPDYSSSPELDGKKLSDAFQIWTYDRDKIKWVDAYEELTDKSYQRRIKLHEQLSGMSFCHLRDNTVLLGDTLLVIPPTNIRHVSQTTYERTPLLRSKGTLVKGGNHNETLLELKLYFAGDAGINGMPYTHKFPSGESCTYYMNGLRGLIAQFKLAPFLPIENRYINDVLNIEAVSLMNIEITSVPEFPKMLEATLIVRAFNYRMYMPDLPLGVEQDIENPSLSQMNPMFAKAFQWDVFRYYYQRQLLAGETISKYIYNSAAYNEYLYRSITALQPTTLCNSSIDFYIPDIDWLDEALARKKDEDNTGLNFETIEISEESRELLKKIASKDEEFSSASNQFNSKAKTLIDAIDNMTVQSIKGTHSISNPKKYLNGKTYLHEVDDSLVTVNILQTYCKPLADKFEHVLTATGYVGEVTVEEVKTTTSEKPDSPKNTLVTWKFNASIPAFRSMDQSEFGNIREFISSNMDSDKNPKSEILKNGNLTAYLHFTFDENNKLFNATSDTNILDEIINQFKMIGDNKVTSSDQNNIDDEDFNWRDPSKMVFVPFIQNALVTEISLGLSNTFTETKLKNVDGIAGQYVGGQDTVINLKIVTCDELLVTQLNALPAISFQYTSQYKRIMSCTPIRIKNDLASLLGVNEVNIEMVDTNTIEGFPGAYEIVLRMVSVDRTLRKRETMHKMEFTANGGYIGKGHGGKGKIKSYFDLDEILSEVEVYPDLELPTLQDLKSRGYGYIRYTLSNNNRLFPDPDFYMVYAYSYTAAILKDQIDTYFKQLLAEEAVDEKGNKITNPLDEVVLDDTTFNAQFFAKLDSVTGLYLMGQSSNQDLVDKELENIIQTSKNLNNKDRNVSKEGKSFKYHKDTETSLKYLLMSNATDGWKIKPSWSAPLCDTNTNALIADMPKAGTPTSPAKDGNNAGAIKLKTTRRDIINLIDKIISKPMDLPTSHKDIQTDVHELDKSYQEERINMAIQLAIKSIFDTEEGKQLEKKLNPLLSMYDQDRGLTDEEFEKPLLLTYLKGFMYASACVTSASKEYDRETVPGMWDKLGSFVGMNPTMYKHGWGPTMWFNNGEETWYKNDELAKVPLCKIEGGANVYIETINDDSKETMDKRIDNMFDKAFTSGRVFGPFGIKMYSSEELMSMTNPLLNYKYVDHPELYKSKAKDGFIDPYYNKLGSDSEELKAYKKAIMYNSYYASEAYLRNVLVWIRKLILDGLFISDVDILSDDLRTVFGSKGLPDLKDKDEQDEILKKAMKKGLSHHDRKTQKKLMKDEDKTGEENDEVVDDLFLMYASLSDTLPKSFCMRLIYPALLACTSGSQLLYKEMLDRNYGGLEALVNGAMSNTSTDRNHRDIRVFFKALYGQRMIELTDLEKSWTDESQKIVNSFNKEMYTEFSNNPKIYAMHSFYDMLMNDKRGRLVRAFPTYYMLIIDEGRKIGYWKLHDNFYNMSSIAEIQVVKSRKNPTDICMLTMTNTFNSYASEYDNETKYKYTDLYGVKDAIDSIFSPSRYFNKIEDIRNNTKLKDKVVLKPGARMHVRMGYSADAARMPALFNGRIAEVNVGEVVELVGQGDGIELVNPLNALGNIEANQIDTAQDIVFPSVFTNLRGSWFKGGLSPKNLLAAILTAEHGGLEEIVNLVSNGRFFNTNPFGIIHFGDQHYKEIFELGEVVQNLFEVSDDDLMPDVVGLNKEPVKEKSTPIINTSIYDKTFWDLMHMSAKAGRDYNCAIRDFGFRSTIFLGKNNHYYAYGYKNDNNNIYEKRKPFQQFHYIDYNCDVIYNTISASERDIKTNAVGLWQSTNKTFGRKSSTTMPMHLDINIYPEYQKSMTYDTGLLADGNGGIDIGLFTSLAENHAFSGSSKSEDKVHDDKVNVKLAERMTVNALKDAVKDMYSGEVTIMGSPAIKPFDLVHLRDLQEDMVGDFEVETVIHTLNANTGFTTTIHPDLIVRMKEDAQTVAVSQVRNQALIPFTILTGTTYTAMAAMAQLDNRLLRAVANLHPLRLGMSTTKKAVDNIFNSKLVTRNLSIFDSNLVNQIDDKLGKVGMSITHQLSVGYIKSLNGLMDEFTKFSLGEGASTKDILKYMNTLEHLDLDALDNNLDTLIKKAEIDGKDVAKYKELQKEIQNVGASYKNLYAGDGIDMSDFFYKLKDTHPDLYKGLDLGHFEKKNFKLNSSKDLNKLNNILKDKDLNAKLIGKNADEVLSSSFKNGVSSITKFGDVADEAKGIGKLTKLVKNIDPKDFVKVLSGTGKFLANMGLVVIQMAATAVVGKMTRAAFMAWFDSLQTLTIYPMKQYGKNFVAGISGAKTCTYGSPSPDGWNSIQGMVMQAYDKIDNGNWIAKIFLQPLVDGFLIDQGEFAKMSQQYKESLGIVEGEMSEDDVVRTLYDNVSQSFDMQRQKYSAQINRVRIQSLDGYNKDEKGNPTATSYNKYALRNIKPENIASDPEVAKLTPVNAYPPLQSYIKDEKLVLAHDLAENSKTIGIGQAAKAPVSIMPDPNNNKTKTAKSKSEMYEQWDIAALREDALLVLTTIMDENYKIKELEKNIFQLYSGTVINSNNWRSTGYSFYIKPTLGTKTKAAIDNASKLLNSGKYKMFEYSRNPNHKDFYNIRVYPPKK